MSLGGTGLDQREEGQHRWAGGGARLALLVWGEGEGRVHGDTHGRSLSSSKEGDSVRSSRESWKNR